MGTSLQEQLAREVSTLPTAQAATVLEFVRWLKAQATPDSELEAHLDAALAAASRQAQGRGISEADVAAEIAAHRAGR